MSTLINTFDIETAQVKNYFIPMCVSFIFKNKTYSFWGEDCINKSFEQINDLIIHKNVIYTFYIHNLNFDGFLILDYITKNNIKFDVFLIKNNIFFIKIFYKSSTFEFKCSYKLYPLPLQEIAEKFLNDSKLPYPYKILHLKKKPTIILQKFFNNKKDYINYITLNGKHFDYKNYTISYCEKDALLTLNLVKKFWKSLQALNISRGAKFFSISAISAYFFYKKCNVYKINKCIPAAVDNFVRNAFYGGRCEVFGNPKKNEYVYYFDFAGMYAQCMLEDFPKGEPYFIYSNFDISTPGFYKISWFLETGLPVLPLRTQLNKLMFYSGYGEGTYWHEEILLFLKEGGKIIKIFNALIFKEKAKIFENFINEVNKIKVADSFNKKLGKLLINSLYGRLGMFINQTKCVITTVEALKNFSPLTHKILNDTVFAEVYNEKISNFSNVIYAAAITSKARIKLFNGFKSVVAGGGRLLYCDTDSIAASFKEVQINKKFGEVFFDKNSWIKDAVFVDPKTYSIKYSNTYITKIKGFKQNTISFLNFKKNFYSKKTIVKLKQKLFLLKNLKLKSKQIFKTINFKKYDKRKFSKDKKTTTPFYNYIQIE